MSCRLAFLRRPLAPRSAIPEGLCQILVAGWGSVRAYSFWVADALYNQYLRTHDSALIKELFPDLISNYEAWEKEKLDSTGLFWQVDDRDGMEVSICGSGYRATINSYMYADAMAIAKIAALMHEPELANSFEEKAEAIKLNTQQALWDQHAAFFKVLPRTTDAKLCTARELHGYTPWYVNLPDERFSVAWKYLMDPKHFYAPYGPTTAEQNHSGFKISYQGHECQWNGPSWPMATSITLTALANMLNNYSQKYVTKEDYFKLIQIYSNSHQRKREDGKVVPWIDENLNPFTGDWISRTRLKAWNEGAWSAEKGGVERGKDYNHSTFADLIITGLIGLRPQPDNRLIIHPLIPEDKWEYFCLDNIPYHGHIITVFYDKTGKRYRKGKGFQVWVDGIKKATYENLQKMSIEL